MEARHRNIIAEQYPDEIVEIELYVLDIPDDYAFMDQELVQCIRDGVEPYLSE